MDDETELTLQNSFKDALPTMLAYISIGFAYGIIATAAHESPLQVGLTSLTLYAGSAQFLLVNLLTQHATIGAVAFLVFLVNFRFMLMALDIAQHFKKQSLLSSILMGSLTVDEGYGVYVLAKQQHRLMSVSWMQGINLWSYASWFGASIIGALFGQVIPNPNQFGLDYAMLAMFAGLWLLTVQGFWTLFIDKHLKIIETIVISIVSYGIFLWITTSTIAIFMATIIGGIIGMRLEGKYDNR